MNESYNINSLIQGSDESDLISVSDAAITALNQIIAANNTPEDYFVRVKSESGGCSGLTFSLEFDFAVKEMDRFYECGGVNFCFDSKTIFYAMGVTIDYIEEPDNSGFVFRGYRNFKTCGCKSGI
jgi:iron-sulfur cluster assembly protein